jgi:predicted nucleic acid-binding protein
MITAVVDCSIAMNWLFGAEATPATRALLRSLERSVVMVPSIWTYEVANAMLVAERRGIIERVACDGFLETLGLLTIEIDYAGFDRGLRVVAELARDWRLSAYDAAYLELARREQLALATLDEGLAAAARGAGVELLPV